MSLMKNLNNSISGSMFSCQQDYYTQRICEQTGYFFSDLCCCIPWLDLTFRTQTSYKLDSSTHFYP